MIVTRLALGFALAVLCGAGAFTASGVQADSPTPDNGAQAIVHVAPTPHKYGADGMRMGLHCDATDLSMP